MIEPYIILFIWIVNAIISGSLIYYFQKNKRRQTDFSGWTFGIILWDIFITIFCIVIIFAYLNGNFN